MLDFKELSKDGQDLELLTREILFKLGHRVYWSGKGQDGGKDLICKENYESIFQPNSRTWLIQCKHNAHSGNSVGLSDLGQIKDSCIQHGANGYVLVCSTHPSSSVVERLESITINSQDDIIATYWDAVKIERLLSTVNLWSLAQRFFPISANVEDWKLFATTNPNYWIVNYRGYHFHLVNRISSTVNVHLCGIAKRISTIEKVELPQQHLLRVRSIHYDDKNAQYTWFLDYLYPGYNKIIDDIYFSEDEITVSETNIRQQIGDETTLEDGQTYYFCIRKISYNPYSDYYDQDRYDYYTHESGCFLKNFSGNYCYY